MYLYFINPALAIKQVEEMKAKAEALKKTAEAAAKKAGLTVKTTIKPKEEEEEYQTEFQEPVEKPMKKYLIIGGVSLAVLGLGIFLIIKLAKRKK